MCGQVDAPRERGSAAEDLDVAVRKQLFHQVAVAAQHARVVDTEPCLKERLDLPVARLGHVLADEFRVRVAGIGRNQVKLACTRQLVSFRTLPSMLVESCGDCGLGMIPSLDAA